MRLLNEEDVIKTVAMALTTASQKGAYSNTRKAQEMVKQIPTAELRPLSEDEAETICIIVHADIEELCRQHRWNEAKEIEQALDKVIYISTNLETLPSTEPEIIRCKDCKWWEREAEDSPMGYCHACKHGHYSRHWEIHIIRTYEEDFFCADAELKEEEEEE